MYKIYRRTIYIVFVVIFLITAPLIVLYTAGYRYNLSKGRIQKTGILIISSIPKKAEIYLNEKKEEKKTTPAEIKNVLPGDYEIILSKNGYHNWQKKLPVYENFTTFAEKVNLWKLATSTKISNSVVSAWQASNDGNKVVFSDSSGSIGIFDLNDNTFWTIESLPANSILKSLSWSPNNKKILINYVNQGKEGLKLYNISLDKIQTLNNNGLQNIKWSQDNDDMLYAQNNKGIWQVDTNKNSNKLIIETITSGDYEIKNNYLYGLDNKYLYRKNISDVKSSIENINTISCPQCVFVKNNSNKIILQDKNQNLFIIDSNNQAPTVYAKGKTLNWLNNNSLLYYNDFEIWIYNFNESGPKLITRFGQPINQAIWQPLGKHIIFSSDNRIKIIELDDRELRNIIDLANNVNAKFLEIDRKGDNIYFAGELSGELGIFKLNIQ